MGLRERVVISPVVDEMDDHPKPLLPRRPPAAYQVRNTSPRFPVEEDAVYPWQIKQTAHRRAQPHWITTGRWHPLRCFITLATWPARIGNAGTVLCRDRIHNKVRTSVP